MDSQMPSCKEVTRLIASEELVDAGWGKRFLARLHLMMCRHCRRYAAELRTIGVASRDQWSVIPSDAPTIERLQSSILDRALGASDQDTEDRRTRDPEPPAT